MSDDYSPPCACGAATVVETVLAPIGVVWVVRCSTQRHFAGTPMCATRKAALAAWHARILTAAGQAHRAEAIGLEYRQRRTMPAVESVHTFRSGLALEDVIDVGDPIERYKR